MTKPTLCLLLLACALFFSCSGDDDVATGSSAATETVDEDDDNTTATVDSTYEYQLPVIFHVLYQDKTDESQYISATRLKTLLTYINNMYKGGVYGESEDCKLQFVLAEYDEDGEKLSTPGVEYVYYSGEYPIDEIEFMYSEDNVKYIWDPNEYINVMLYNFKQTDDEEVVLGVSHMPYTVSGSNALEGLTTTSGTYIRKSQLGYPLCSSINSIYAGPMEGGGYYQSSRYQNPNSSSYTLISSDIVVTMSHELGHYLGLFHAFTDSEDDDDGGSIIAAADSCADTDYCEDTPSYNRSDYVNYLSSYLNSLTSSDLDVYTLLRRQSCEGEEYYSANIMDYAYTLGYKISSDQKARIRNVLMYSPLIPGPKLNGVNKTRAAQEDSDMKYNRPRIIK